MYWSKTQNLTIDTNLDHSMSMILSMVRGSGLITQLGLELKSELTTSEPDLDLGIKSKSNQNLN